MTRWITRPAARDDSAELVRLAWGFGRTEKASELDAALRAVAGRLAARGDIEGLVRLLGLPDYGGRPPAEDPGVKELVSLGPSVSQAVMGVARTGDSLTRMRAVAVLQAVGEKQAADDVRRLLEGLEWLPGSLPSEGLPSTGGRGYAWNATVYGLSFAGGVVAFLSHPDRSPIWWWIWLVCLAAATQAGYRGPIGAWMVQTGIGCIPCILGVLQLSIQGWGSSGEGIGALVGGVLVVASGLLRWWINSGRPDRATNT